MRASINSLDTTSHCECAYFVVEKNHYIMFRWCLLHVLYMYILHTYITVFIPYPFIRNNLFWQI